MRWSRLFIPTLRENPADAECPSHRLLVRAGFVRQLAAGIYSFLPLGRRTARKITGIIREEFDRAGAQEFSLPALHPEDLLQETSRRAGRGENRFRLRDRSGRALLLSMAHEEVFTEIARKEIRSHKDLPQIWYQIQAGFSDEMLLKSGLLRLRQFLSMNSCSFDIDHEGLDRSYRLHRELYGRIFARCGLKCAVVEASSGAAGGSQAEAFMVPMDAGEDSVVACACGYAADPGRAKSWIPKMADEPADGPPREVPTPGQKTIAEIAAFLGVPPSHQIKSLVHIVNERPCLFLLRGDHQLNEAKAMAAAKSAPVRPARPEEIRELFGADAGSLGPVGIRGLRIIADLELQGRQNLTCGANKDDFHLQGVTPEVHFAAEWADLRTVEAGEACVRCRQPLSSYRATEVGRIAKLGTGDSESLGARVLTAGGKQTPIVMGSYSMGIERIMSSAVELFHDDDGIIWPPAISPFAVVITPVNYRDEVKEAADRLHADLLEAGLDALLDDRQERPGVKFKDADLIGIPYRIVLGAEKVRRGQVELFERAARKVELVGIESVVSLVRRKLHPD